MMMMMMTMDSGIARGRAHTTVVAVLLKRAAIFQLIGWRKHAALVYSLHLSERKTVLRSFLRIPSRTCELR